MAVPPRAMAAAGRRNDLRSIGLTAIQKFQQGSAVLIGQVRNASRLRAASPP